MRLTLLDVLGCPTCRGGLSCVSSEARPDGDVVAGALACARCERSYPIRAGIPRFVSDDTYASSFGYQWNRFRQEQLDSVNGTTLSRDRFHAETGWTSEWMAGKWLLDAGCGAGRFLDVVTSGTTAEVVGLDITNAIDAAHDNLRGHPRLHLVQASLYDLPFRDEAFDGVYCIGVIQHTPHPLRAVAALPRVLRAGGRIAYTIYERRRHTRLYSKYLVRPLTRRLPAPALLAAIRIAMPVLFPLTEAAFRIPGLGRLARAAIPVANYVDQPIMTLRQRYAWALMDTFDMLAPAFDAPQVEPDVRTAMSGAGIGEIRRGTAPGLNLIGRKLGSIAGAQPQ